MIGAVIVKVVVVVNAGNAVKLELTKSKEVGTKAGETAQSQQ